jgi:hypothetical protein
MTLHRSGAALIMAIVILAAMLMIGLPFLFSQSASLSGTRSFAHSQQAQAGRSTAEDLGIGKTTELTRNTLPQGSTAESTDLNNVGQGLTASDDPRRRTLDLSPGGHGFNPAEPRNTALLGVSIEDESGKLNPNYMDTEAWKKLFEKVGIVDWDDGDDGPGGRLDDDLDQGQLAGALAAARFDRAICREGRITHLEQLLEVRPQPDGIRLPLSRSELAQLKPFLTLVSLGQGREGLIDLGTMITNPGNNQNNSGRLDTLLPVQLSGFPVARDLIGAGSVVVMEPRRPIPPQERAAYGNYRYGLSTSMDLENVLNRSGNTPHSFNPRAQDAVAFAAPPPVNLNETSTQVRWVLKGIDGKASQLSDMVRLTAKRPDAFNRTITGQTLQNPLGVYESLGSSVVQPTRPSDPNSGLDQNATGNTVLTASATWIHLRGGNLGSMPKSGYARIDSNFDEQGDDESGNGTGSPPTMNGSNSDPLVEYISYNNPNGVGTTLFNVRRGLSFPGSTGAHEHDTASGRTRLTFIAPRELPPLTLSSQGLVTIESGSTVADAAGRQGAQQFRRAIAQAVPQEQFLEMRWEKQSQYHALLVQRHGSLMNAFPKPYQRQFDVEPDNRTNVSASNDDQRIGVRPATLRTLLTSSHLGSNWRNGHAWSRSFSMKQANDNPLNMGDMEYQQNGSSYNANDLTPEGLLLNGSPLSYDVFFEPHQRGFQNGFLTYPLRTDNTSPTINGRQFGLWVKPNATLSGDVTFFDLRSPVGNAGQRFQRKPSWLPLDPMDGGKDPREPGDSLYQNRITLAYEHQTRQLVLTIANGAIEHTEDHGPAVPSENFDFPAGGTLFAPPPPLKCPYVDPRSLGNEVFSGVIACTNPIGAKRPLNLVQHRYQLDRANGLRPNQWHQIQVGFVGNDPGHMAIIVNGIVGRNISKALATTNVMTLEHGDHLTLPSLVLATDLAGTQPDYQSGNVDLGSTLLIPQIPLKAIAVDPLTRQVISGAAAVAALLPKRGCIRVDDEYISYDAIEDSKLMNCLRARRQDSIAQHPRFGNRRLNIQPHLAGALVVPGGIRYNPGRGLSGHLWRGGCRLTDPLPNGLPPEIQPMGMTIGSFNVWTKLSRPPAINPMTGTPWIQDTDTTIRVNGGALMEWPSRGYAVLQPSGEVIYYDNGAPINNTMGVLQNVQRGQLGTMAASVTWPTMPTNPTDYNITLISFEVTGTATGNYEEPPLMPPPPNTPIPDRLVQILDAQTGRIEWIRYNRIDISKGPNFFLGGTDYNNNIYTFDHLRRNSSNRARERTAFAGVDIPGAPLFAKDSRVIPVQTSLGRANLLLTGDVLTIMPKRPGSVGTTNGRPYQVCVRYAATDGVHPTDGSARPPNGNLWDTMNPYFAFTEALQDNWPDDSFELMSWPAWSGNDLSSTGRTTSNGSLPAFTMPLAASFLPDYALGRPQFKIGGNDTNQPFLQSASNPASFEGVIDALYAGEQVGGTARIDDAPEDNIIIRLGTNTNETTNNPRFASNTVWLPAGALTNIIVQSSNDVFRHELGIMQIGGEVFAYEQQRTDNGNPHTRAARIIGRGLFGSKAVEHRGQEPIMILPIGPVARLLNNLSSREDEVKISPHYNKRHDQDELNAPAIMMCSPNGTRMELIGMPNRLTAPWLRGMYNTKEQGNWVGSTNYNAGSVSTDTLVIGWWPRYPSALRAQADWPAGTDERSAMLRCRMYSWMGFPIRFYDTWLKGGNGLLDIELINDGQGTFSVFAAALDKGFDWNTAVQSSFTLTPSSGPQDASAIFSRFQRQAVDGVEVRVRWEYRVPMADSSIITSNPTDQNAVQFLDRVATAGNTAPMIGTVKLRARAPTKVLQVEETR